MKKVVVIGLLLVGCFFIVPSVQARSVVFSSGELYFYNLTASTITIPTMSFPVGKNTLVTFSGPISVADNPRVFAVPEIIVSSAGTPDAPTLFNQTLYWSSKNGPNVGYALVRTSSFPLQKEMNSANPSGYDFYPGQKITKPTKNFCDKYFTCVSTFWKNKKGYVVECHDGKYSHFGGKKEACSKNGGVWRTLYTHQKQD